MDYLFVSYSRWDRQNDSRIDHILADLRAAGIRLWLVPDDVPAGADWSDIKWDKLAQADGLLFIFSRPLTRTPQMLHELEIALNSNLPVFPLMLNNDLVDQIPQQLLALQPILFDSDDFEDALPTLIARLPDSVRESRPVVPEQPKSKGYVFISYADEDTDFVTTLRDYLKERGYGYWDYQDSDRNYHTQLFLELEDVIRNASATVSILSPDWKRSTWAAKEYMFSEQVGTPVFLLMAREMGPTLVIAGVPYIDFVRDPEGGFAKLDRELRRKGLI